MRKRRQFYIINGSGVSISFNSGYNYNSFLQYDAFGAIIQIKHVPIYYDFYGRVSRIGNIYINYNRHGYVAQVGGHGEQYRMRVAEQQLLSQKMWRLIQIHLLNQ